MRLRIVARRLHHLDAAFDDGLTIFVIGNGRDRRQNREIDAEGLVGEVAAFPNLLGKVFGLAGGMRRDEAERAGIGDRADQFRLADAGHAAAGDGCRNAEHFRKTGLEHGCLLLAMALRLSVVARGASGKRVANILRCSFRQPGFFVVQVFGLHHFSARSIQCRGALASNCHELVGQSYPPKRCQTLA